MADVGAVILAGGLASRMGGGDKCLLNLGNQRLIDHVFERLEGYSVALNVNGDQSRLGEIKAPLLPDPLPGFPGPLAGILAGLDWAWENGYSGIVSVAGDTPFFPRDLPGILINAGAEGRIAIAQTPSETGRIFPQPTFGYWPLAVRDPLRLALEQGVRKIMHFVQSQAHCLVDFEDEDAFFNINTPADLATAEKMLGAAA